MSLEFEQPDDQIFDNPDSRSGSATLLFLGSAGLIALAIVCFLAAIRTPHGQMTLHLTTTLPTIVAIGLLARGISLRTIPRRIVVGADAIEITTNQGPGRYHWSEIGTATTANVLNSHKTCLRITDTTGKTIIRVDEAFPDYRRLVRLVQSCVDAKIDDTSIRLMTRKAHRTAILLFVFGGFLAFAALFIAWQTSEKQRAHELLTRKGVPGIGAIVRRFVAPNGSTKRLEYRVAGSGLKNVAVDPTFWDELEQAKTVDVIYVPDEPDISRLALGELQDSDVLNSPRGAYLLAGLGGLMAAFFFGFSPFAWKGYDLAFDDQRRIWKLKRYGRVVWASQKEAIED